MPAADPETLSPALIERIADALADHGIGHGRLRAGTPHLNLNLTDRNRVFVKISRAGERTNRPGVELAGARWASQQRLNTVTALVDKVLDIDDEHGETRAVTVWAWLEPTTAPGLLDQTRAVADLIATLAATPAPPDTSVFDLAFFADRIRGRLAGLTTPDALTIGRAAEETGHAIAQRLDPDRYLWIHGDLHTENILWPLSSNPVLLDWESHTLGPIEWDIAQLVRSVRLRFPDHDATEKDRAVAEAAHRLDARDDIDWGLVDLCARFRSASSASHLLIHGHQPGRLAADLTLLDDTSAAVADDPAA